MLVKLANGNTVEATRKSTIKRLKRIAEQNAIAFKQQKFYKKSYVIGKTQRVKPRDIKFEVKLKEEVNTNGLNVEVVPSKSVKSKHKVKYKAKAQTKMHLSTLYRMGY